MATPGQDRSSWERGLLSKRGAALAILFAASVFGGVDSIRDLIRNERFAAALAECDRELIAAPRSVPILTLKGFALRGAGRMQDSLTAFHQAIKVDPAYLPALQAAAQIEFETRDPQARRTHRG